MNGLQQFATFFNVIFALATTVGAFLAFRHARSNANTQLQNDTIHILQAQIGALKDEMERMKQEMERMKEDNTHQKTIIETIQAALRQQGIHITINGEMITITDETPPEHRSVTGHRITTVRVPKSNTPIPPGTT
jgi:cell division protein FtsB